MPERNLVWLLLDNPVLFHAPDIEGWNIGKFGNELPEPREIVFKYGAVFDRRDGEQARFAEERGADRGRNAVLREELFDDGIAVRARIVLVKQPFDEGIGLGNAAFGDEVLISTILFAPQKPPPSPLGFNR